MVVIGVLAVLALVALPTYTDKIVRDQVVQALPLADIAKQPVNLAWSQSLPLPADNAAAGLPSPDRIVSTLVSSVTVQDGAIHIRFGNSAHRVLKGRTLSLRPAGVEEARVVPLAWICAKGPVPDKMTAKGADLTDIPAGLLPMGCR